MNKTDEQRRDDSVNLLAALQIDEYRRDGVQCVVKTRSGFHDLFAESCGPFSYGDLTFGLVNLFRWSGQFPFPFSVATHSCMCCDAAGGNRELAYACLLHDGAEHVIGDMSSPIKRFDPFFLALERRIQAQVEAHYHVSRDPVIRERVHAIDCDQNARESTVMASRFPAERVPRWSGQRALEEFGSRFFSLAPLVAKEAVLRELRTSGYGTKGLV